MDEFDLLLSKITSSLRSGDVELANYYEDQVKDLGVDVVATDYPELALTEFGINGMSRSSVDDVDMPEDSATVHWYRYAAIGNCFLRIRSFDEWR